MKIHKASDTRSNQVRTQISINPSHRGKQIKIQQGIRQLDFYEHILLWIVPL